MIRVDRRSATCVFLLIFLFIYLFSQIAPEVSALPNIITSYNGASVQLCPLKTSQTCGRSLASSYQYLTVSSNPAFGFGTNDFSISFTIFYFSIPVVDGNRMAIVNLKDSAANRWRLDLRYHNNYYRYEFWQVENGVLTILSSFIPKQGVQPNRWYDVSLVRKGNKWTLYQDGISAGTDVHTQAVRSFNANLSIGAEANTDYFLNASLFNFRIQVTKSGVIQTILWLRFQGTVGSTNFTDSAPG